VEGNNFEARKRLLDYDDVMNQQREVIYDLRLFALEGGEDLKGEVWDMVEHTIRDLVEEYCSREIPEEDWDLPGLRQRLLLDYFILVERLPTLNTDEPPFDDPDEVTEVVLEAAREQFHRKLEDFGEAGERVMSWIMLSVIDDKWKDHLYDLDHLKASIGFRGWGQKDPLVEYKREAYDMFVDLMTDIRKTVSSLFFRAQVGQPQPQRVVTPRRLVYSGPTDTAGSRLAAAAAQQAQGGGGVDELGVVRRGAAVPGPAGGPDPRQLLTNRGEERQRIPVSVAQEPGRNDPCPCGSGKKYKKCHGRKG